MNRVFPGWVSSGAEGDRTPDLCIANAALSQLSYGPGRAGKVAAWERLSIDSMGVGGGKTRRRVVLDVVDPRIAVVIFRALSRLAGSGLPGESRRGS
jgi:hypothetical protein